MKKRVNFLGLILILILMILMFFLIKNFTGYASKEPDKQISFYFKDNNSNCPLNGYISAGEKAIGKTNNGFFNLSYEDYVDNVNATENLSIFGQLGSCFDKSELFFDKYFIMPSIKKSHFIGGKTFNFEAKIDFNNPFKKELQGFIQQKKLSSEIDKIILNKENIPDDLSEINSYLSRRVIYIPDAGSDIKENYWQTPQETLDIKQGDCEDYSTALLSLFLAYNSSLNCYNLIFSSHVTTFCHIEDYYVYYDRDRIEIKQEIDKKEELKAKIQLLELKKDYLTASGINVDSKNKLYYAFNDDFFIELKNDEELVNWQYNLKNKKEDFDLFLNIENEIKKNTENLSGEFGEGQLRTQSLLVPKSKFISYVIMSLFILIILLIIFLIKINRKK